MMFQLSEEERKGSEEKAEERLLMRLVEVLTNLPFSEFRPAFRGSQFENASRLA
jgi:hypothetical protein